MKEYAKLTTISNSVDTHGVCWLFGWGYFCGQSTDKTRKKAENLKFEIWFTDNQHVHLRKQTFKISLKMLMSYFCESRRFFWRRSWEICYNERRYLILLQLRNKIALSSRCPPQASFLSLCSHIGHNASGLRCSDYNLWRIRFREEEKIIRKVLSNTQSIVFRRIFLDKTRQDNFILPG